MNWSHQVNKITLLPETVAEAVDRLLLVLSDDQKDEITAMKEDELFVFNFTLGLAIRNSFGLHDLGSKLLADCGTPHPDDGAGVIVKKIWKKLKVVNENTD